MNEGTSRHRRHILDVKDLTVEFATKRGVARVVDGVSFYLDEGESLGIVGESGCGKSMMALGILRLIPPPGKIVHGMVSLEGVDLTGVSGTYMRKIRGGQIAIQLQDPMTSLNPAFSIGAQVGEAVRIHQKVRGSEMLRRVLSYLNLVRIPAAEARVSDFPHQMSGGMRQRVSGAMGISCTPKILICDEPTTALDVTIQAQYLDLLKEIQERTQISLIFITHDMGIIANMCDRVLVMYAGRIVESGTVDEVLLNPLHPYTISLLNCVPSVEEVKALESIEGQPPDPVAYPRGCRFAPRCPKAEQICHDVYPEVADGTESHVAACHFPGDWRNGK